MCDEFNPAREYSAALEKPGLIERNADTDIAWRGLEARPLLQKQAARYAPQAFAQALAVVPDVEPVEGDEI